MERREIFFTGFKAVNNVLSFPGCYVRLALDCQEPPEPTHLWYQEQHLAPTTSSAEPQTWVAISQASNNWKKAFFLTTHTVSLLTLRLPPLVSLLLCNSFLWQSGDLCWSLLLFSQTALPQLAIMASIIRF